jgi:hypothetical protein
LQGIVLRTLRAEHRAKGLAQKGRIGAPGRRSPADARAVQGMVTQPVTSSALCIPPGRLPQPEDRVGTVAAVS